MAHERDLAKQQFWLKHIHDWQRLKLTVREFCRRHQLNEHSFHAWRRQLRQRGLLTQAPVQSTDKTAAFVRLTVAGETAASAVEVVVGKRVLRVRPGYDADMLLELVRLLEEPSC